MIKKYLNKDMYLLENTTNQPSKFKTKNWVEKMMNHEEGITRIIKLDLNIR